MKTISMLCLLALMAVYGCGQKKKVEHETGQKPTSSEEIKIKVDELLGKMSLEEKVGQMIQINLHVVLKGGYGNNDASIDTSLLDEAVKKIKVGSVLNAINHAYTVDTWHEVITTLQQAAQSTPHKIPVIYGIDAIHGVTFTQKSVLFPQNIGLAATRNPQLSSLAGEITAKETRASGIRWNFAPVLDVARMPLWPRFEETYGEDTYLVSQMGVASIVAMQGKDLSDPSSVAACMKHFLGYSMPASGKDRTPAYIPDRQLREIFLPPFKAATDAGCATVMINSGEINGLPVHANKYLLTDVLRSELGFKGVAVTDWEDIIRLHTRHKIAPTMKDAVRIAINAGIDMSMIPDKDYIVNFYNPLIELVKEGKVSEDRINEAVGRILTLKYKLGLFQNPFPEKEAQKYFGLPEYKLAALQSARESITLLKNENNILPLEKNKKVLVVGPGAKSITSLNGSWSYTWQGNDPKWYPDSTAYILNAIKEKVGAGNVFYAQGASFDSDKASTEQAVKLAERADYIVLCLGEDAYAESPGVIDELDLPAGQQQLAKALYKTGKPVVIVLTEGRPRLIREIEPEAKGILMAYVPGSQGHIAIADVLFGDYNPDGKLPFTYPRYSGDLIPYDHKFTDRVNELKPGLIDSTTGYKPQWPFGYGLSYTNFEFSNLQLNAPVLKGDGTVKVSVDVKNSGTKTGKVAVELYTRDLYASVTPAYKKLRKFKKVSIDAGQAISLEFELSKKDLAFVGLDSKTWITEPGYFLVMIGGLEQKLKYEE